MFIGTPRKGGSGVVLYKLTVYVASVFIAADNRLLQHSDQNSEWLQQQLGQYGPISGDFVAKRDVQAGARCTLALTIRVIVVSIALSRLLDYVSAFDAAKLDSMQFFVLTGPERMMS
jgi:hypothetical protein